MKTLIIKEPMLGQRLDRVLANAFPDYSRSSLEKLIESGFVLVNDKPRSPSYKLKTKDNVKVDFSPFEQKAHVSDIPIIYEDKDVLVLDKPAGLLTHSKGTFNAEATVASFISKKLSGSKEWVSSNRAGIVHRLDRGTSGVIICAKTETSQGFLQKQFSRRNVKKTYLALVEGTLTQPEGIIDVPIERNPKKPSSFRAGANGKIATTHYKVKEQKENITLLELSPTTGRTHQLRVHLAFIRHPIIGDTLYGGITSQRTMLHAHKLELTLPSKQRRTFIALIPKEFRL